MQLSVSGIRFPSPDGAENVLGVSVFAGLHPGQGSPGRPSDYCADGCRHACTGEHEPAPRRAHSWVLSVHGEQSTVQ
jgi:hypothetical protein